MQKNHSVRATADTDNVAVPPYDQGMHYDGWNSAPCWPLPTLPTVNGMVCPPRAAAAPLPNVDGATLAATLLDVGVDSLSIRVDPTLPALPRERVERLALFAHCVRERLVPGALLGTGSLEDRHFLWNLFACLRGVPADHLRFIIGRSHSRLTIEEGMALVLSFLPGPDAARLIPYCGFLVLDSHMMAPPGAAAALVFDDPRVDEPDGVVPTRMPKYARGSEPLSEIDAARLRRLFFKLNLALGWNVAQGDYQELLKRLALVRREGAGRIVLDVPAVVLRAAAEHGARFDALPREEEEDDGEARVKRQKVAFIGRKLFRRVQRHLWGVEGRNDPTSRYTRAVAELKEHNTRGDVSLELLTTTTDPLALAYGFLVSQRRRQLKVVSDVHGGFLFPGRSCFQNQHHLSTSVEDELVDMALERAATSDFAAFSAARVCERLLAHVLGPQARVLDVMKTLDRACILCERYVELFAAGDASRCVFKVDGPRGGSGRGPVDVYNVLVKVIREANARAVALGVPESELPRVQYFLAKDIMTYSGDWHKDAFATTPGFVSYLARRRRRNELCSPDAIGELGAATLLTQRLARDAASRLAHVPRDITTMVCDYLERRSVARLLRGSPVDLAAAAHARTLAQNHYPIGVVRRTRPVRNPARL